MIEALNLKPSDMIAVAVQEGDGQCLIVSSDGSGTRPDFATALAAAAEDAFVSGRAVLIPHQSISALRILLMGQQDRDKLPPFVR